MQYKYIQQIEEITYRWHQDGHRSYNLGSWIIEHQTISPFRSLFYLHSYDEIYKIASLFLKDGKDKGIFFRHKF